MASKSMGKILIGGLVITACGVGIYYSLPMFSNSFEYESESSVESLDTEAVTDIKDTKENTDEVDQLEIPDASLSLLPITHIDTPEKVKAVYMSAWVAGGTKFRNPIIKQIDETELNAVVIDIKDSTGKISFHVKDPEVSRYGAMENRIADIRALTNMLHQKNIYIIGRISVFQDPYMTKHKPEWAVTRISDGGVWKDRKGLSFIDPTNKDAHRYIVALARASYEEGFDEINFDYIRYPSDGNMKDINYNLKAGKSRADNLEDFFRYLSVEMKKDKNIPTSADLFGLTTEVTNDMGIGQLWEKALPHFDYLAPMVYPSHYPNGTMGYKNPAEHPYEIINNALKSAVTRTKTAGYDTSKIRPWLQDFNLGATYTKEMIRAQIKASNDNGIDSWMLWDPANTYTTGGLELENTQ